MGHTLVIVESPAKCKKIEQFLGPGYVCKASMGHVTELHHDASKVTEVPNGRPLALQYPVSRGKAQAVQVLKRLASKASSVVLAMDDDREGEAIAWHVANLLNLPEEGRKRAVFHEITQQAVKEAVANLRDIDLPLVQAQRARQFLDMQVGFRVSPAIRTRVGTPGKVSAGRCQTPALRILGDLHSRNQSATLEVIYTVRLSPKQRKLQAFDLEATFDSPPLARSHLERSIDFEHKITTVRAAPYRRQPPLPFTTSSFQQAASSQLRVPPKQAMRYAQTLYEAGRITYMRTDSTILSVEFVQSAQAYVTSEFGADARGPPQDAGEEGAHEAIRPTKVGDMAWQDGEDPKLDSVYKLIWERAVQATMATATFDRVSVQASSPHQDSAMYKSTALREVNPGWTLIGGNAADAECHAALAALQVGEVLPFTRIAAKGDGRGTARYLSEAGLVKKLEELGIGRPSTYASLVSTIQDRGYVKKGTVKAKEVEVTDFLLARGTVTADKKVKKMGGASGKLLMQPHGLSVLAAIDPTFTSLFAYGYTASMERDLDEVARGSRDWTSVCGEVVSTLNRVAPLRAPGRTRAKPYAMLGKKSIFLRRSRFGPFLVMGKRIIGLDEDDVPSLTPDSAAARFRGRS